MDIKQPEMFGEKLVSRNMISQAQLDEALDYQTAIGGRLGAILVKLGMMSEDDLVRGVAELANVPMIAYDEVRIDPMMAEHLSRDKMEHGLYFPLQGENEEELLLAMADPLDLEIIDGLAFDTNRVVKVFAIGISDAEKALRDFFKIKKSKKKADSSKEDSKELAKRQILHTASTREVLDALIETLRKKGIVDYDSIISKLDE